MTVLFLLSFNRISIQISDLHWHSTEGRGGVRSSGCGSVWSVGPNKHKVHMSNAFWFHVVGQFYRINRSALIDSFLTWGLTSRHEDKLTVTESPGMFFDNFWTHTADEAQFLISPDKFTLYTVRTVFKSEWGPNEESDNVMMSVCSWVSWGETSSDLIPIWQVSVPDVLGLTGATGWRPSQAADGR